MAVSDAGELNVCMSDLRVHAYISVSDNTPQIHWQVRESRGG